MVKTHPKETMWNFLSASARPTKFEEQYHCYSAAYADKPTLEQGDKILLPPSAFDILARLQVDYPMLFQLQSQDRGTLTHCGVLEFTAEEGSCVIPFWMMQNLLIEEGAVLTVTNVSLPKANFVKFQAQHVDFLEISNPRAVLEHALRNFSCITKGDVICVPYNSKNYHFEIKEVRPQDAACIIETDCHVDFDAPRSSIGERDESKLDIASESPETKRLCTAGTSIERLSQSHPSSLSAASGCKRGEGGGEEGASASRIRIVDGKIVRSDENSAEAAVAASTVTEHLASQAGSTGVQPNAAIAVQSPTPDYWALNAGDGARLDGKAPSALKDKFGQEVDLRKIRAEAAARRAAEQAKNVALPVVGKTIKGEEVRVESGQGGDGGGPPVRKNKSRVGGKFSKLSAGTAFHGGSNQFTNTPPSGNGTSPNSASLANLPKQSAFAPPEHRSSACPSPTPSSLSATSGCKRGEGGGEEGALANQIRIVDGKIVRSDENSAEAAVAASTVTEHLASQAGSMGVQPNAAIAVQSPTPDYWVLNAGDGARLDGKAPSALKDKFGQEAAARRAAEQAKNVALTVVGKTIKGEEVRVESGMGGDGGGPPVRKNKSRVGGKFSKLKSAGTVFHGGSNQL
ncbi:hypothetical protein HJC23_004904 [Cyclotella cryptica]|uniref:Uncharacterized protein n=1 Tax=Cyclotella cryptica TaxID=29204 RepID=A0ABD3P924_9STRA